MPKKKTPEVYHASVKDGELDNLTLMSDRYQAARDPQESWRFAYQCHEGQHKTPAALVVQTPHCTGTLPSVLQWNKSNYIFRSDLRIECGGFLVSVWSKRSPLTFKLDFVGLEGQFFNSRSELFNSWLLLVHTTSLVHTFHFNCLCLDFV